MGFSDQTGQNNLQYDDAAFFFFLATLLIGGAIIILFYLLKDWKNSQIPHSKAISNISLLKPQLEATKVLKRQVLKGFALKVKLFGLIIICLLLWLINIQIKNTENKLKGFDPYDILGLTPEASLRDIKKAYRKLALEFHPDRNVGDPEAQAKFILISKSYECFTDDSKKQNCFKYGNPDGNSAFNVGIGLPHFFISKDYQYYVLPVVLSILLIFLPNYFISWSAKAKAQDQSGISLTSYSSLYSTILSPINIFTPLYQLASLAQLYEDCPILSEHDKARLLLDLQKAGAKKPIIQDFNNKQLFILNAVFRYCLRQSELDSELRFKVQKYMSRLIYTFLPFSQRASNGKFLQGNVDWKIQFQGMRILQFQIKFIRCYYNRSFNPNWQQVLRLNQQQQEIAKQLVVSNLYQLISNKQLLDKYIENYPQQRREFIKNQFGSLPIYNLEIKLKVSGREVSQVNTQQYAQFYYRITRKNPSTAGFCNLANYPYLKQEKIYYTMSFQGNVINISEIVFREGESVYIGKIPYRMEFTGTFPINIRLNSDCYDELDVEVIFNLKCVEPPEQLKNGKVKIHQEDLEIQKNHKGFFDELMNASQMEDNELSDSEDE